MFDFKIGGQPIMVAQPSTVDDRRKQERKFIRLGDGTWQVVDRGGGRIVVVTWGSEAAAQGAFDELTADLTAEGAIFTLTWKDPNDNAQSVKVGAELIDSKYGPAPLYSPFTVNFLQVAA